jgi:hypothetical protein
MPIIWIGGFVVAIPTILEYSVYNISNTSKNKLNNTSNNTTTVCGHSSVEPMLTILNCLFVTMVSFVIPLVLMFNNYIKLIAFVNKRCSRISTQTGNNMTTVNQLTVGISSNKLPVQSFHLNKNRIKLVKMLVLMATTFVVSWLPFYSLYVYAVSKITCISWCFLSSYISGINIYPCRFCDSVQWYCTAVYIFCRDAFCVMQT